MLRRINHWCEEYLEKSVPRITVWLASWCQTLIPRVGFFYLPLTPMIDYFSCTSFISERRFVNNAVTSIADVRHIVMTLLWLLMTSIHSVTWTLMMAYGVHYNQCISNTWKLPASVAQLDASSDWRPAGCGFNPRRGRQHSFVEIDHEIFSTVTVSLPLIQEGQLSVSSERMCTILVNRLED